MIFKEKLTGTDDIALFELTKFILNSWDMISLCN